MEKLCKVAMLATEAAINACEEAGVTNEQWFIEWEMKMSELVTKDHNRRLG